MKNDRQTEIVIALRDVLKIPDNESWGAFEDMMRDVAAVLEGAESLAGPTEMHERFKSAWSNYAILHAMEHERIVKDCVGEETFAELREHPKRNQVIRRVIDRVISVHGEITTGMDVDEIEVGDILVDEMGDPAS